MIEPGISDCDDAKGPVRPATSTGRVFGAVVLSAFLVLWLTMTIGMSRFASGAASGFFVIVPLLMAVVGTLVIGGGIVGILRGRKPLVVQRRTTAVSSGDGPGSMAATACAYCGVLAEATRTKCPGCGAPNRL